MSQITRAQLIEAVGQMSVMELCDLIAELEDRWDVRATPALGHVVDDTAYFKMLPYEPPEWDVVMTSFGSSKLLVIKFVRQHMKLGLKDAKDLVENVPAVMARGVDRDEAEELVSMLEATGACAEIV